MTVCYYKVIVQARRQDFKKGVSRKIARLRAAKFFKATPTNTANRAFYACAYCAVPNICYSNIVITITSIVDVSLRS